VFSIVNSLLPEPAQWVGLGATLLTLLMFAGLGSIRGVADQLPGLPILIGWSILAAVLTIVGVFTPWAFTPFFWGLSAISVLSLTVMTKPARVSLMPLLPIFVLGAPLLLVMAGKVPSEVDSFTHWLPNGLYIVENDGFLRADRPESRSVYPGFPYNVTYLFLAASRFAGGFVENAIILFNVTWLLLFAALLAWLLRRSGAVPSGNAWKLAAFALLCTTILNPIFVRRIWLTSYPDTSTSIIIAFAGIAGWLWIEAMIHKDRSEGAKALAFALLLALLINIKQANLVLVVALIIATGMVVLRDWNTAFGSYLKRLPIIVGLPLIFYFSWRYYLTEVTPLHENKMLPFADWPFDRLPDLLYKMGVVVYRKALYFALGLGLFVWGFRVWIGRPKSSFDRLVIIVGATFVGYNLFLLLIFIAHFNGHPQSYWRFNTHIGYLIYATTVYGLGLAYHRHNERLKPSIVASLKKAATALVIVVPLLELGLSNYWRFDLEIPKPLLREAGRELSTRLPSDARIAAIVPGDLGNFTSIFGHYATIDRPDIRASAINKPPHVASFVNSAGDHPTYIWAYCPAGWIEDVLQVDVAPNNAALFVKVGNAWKIDTLWPHRASNRFTKVYKLFDISKCAAGN
jgi:hypothetical protein